MKFGLVVNICRSGSLMERNRYSWRTIPLYTIMQHASNECLFQSTNSRASALPICHPH